MVDLGIIALGPHVKRQHGSRMQTCWKWSTYSFDSVGAGGSPSKWLIFRGHSLGLWSCSKTKYVDLRAWRRSYGRREDSKADHDLRFSLAAGTAAKVEKRTRRDGRVLRMLNSLPYVTKGLKNTAELWSLESSPSDVGAPPTWGWHVFI